MIVRVDGLEHLVGLLEHERFQCVDRLFAIPRAAVWRAQPGDDVDETLEFGGCGGRREAESSIWGTEEWGTVE